MTNGSNGWTRRQFARAAGLSATALTLRGLRAGAWQGRGRSARLTARPKANVATSLVSGPLGLGDRDGRDGVIQMPSSGASSKPLPMLLFLHGATQNGAGMLRRMGPAADAHGIVIVAPDSRAITWDAIRGDFGVDVEFLDRVLAHVFARVAIDPARLTIGGFSDGASYGLSLGLANGDLFPKVMACSPGFIVQAPAQGKPAMFFSHGTSDQILPIDQCSRVIVPRLRSLGYTVTFREFQGRHEIPADIAEEACRWMTGA